MHVSLREANQIIDEKNIEIEAIKTQCEIVSSKISQNWKECLDEKLLEIQALKVFIFLKYILIKI